MDMDMDMDMDMGMGKKNMDMDMGGAHDSRGGLAVSGRKKSPSTHDTLCAHASSVTADFVYNVYIWHGTISFANGDSTDTRRALPEMHTTHKYVRRLLCRRAQRMHVRRQVILHAMNVTMETDRPRV